eukprot:CAMPEP_0115620112 /NCGR_PEP_ID=MMETSP0272-20121206/25033_1 /TAXON_ID=71861 /ORGANISM="Scrippsiella trochoidea, Strain CCMP3099" /LENGTH=370 /DNA_ID=CAMNT_0003056171 /DNA_START=51 /DNA_END=1164 /DNA_ORIENTATION=-
MSQMADSGVLVALAGTPLVADAKKPARECRAYELTVTAAGAQHSFCLRYADLKQALKPYATDANPWPTDCFSGLKDYVHNERRVRRRGEELRRFVAGVLNQRDEGAIVGDSRLHAALLIPPGAPMQIVLQQVAKQRKQAADAARAAEAARRAAIAQQQAADAHFAQTFNSQLAISDLPPGALSTIKFPRQQHFELRNKFWGWGDATIKAGWPPMVQDGAFQPFDLRRALQKRALRDHHARRRTAAQLAGELPLDAYEYDLFRIDPRTRTQVPVCRIVRQWTPFAFTDQYEVTHFQHFLTGRVECFGRWPSQFTLAANGTVVCRVEKELFTFTDTYQVHIAPDADCLLFLGIACAIDRIHHEVEDARRRRE